LAALQQLAEHVGADDERVVLPPGGQSGAGLGDAAQAVYRDA
jgi:hypothetical protein